jgi:hypothetical protein
MVEIGRKLLSRRLPVYDAVVARGSAVAVDGSCVLN